jgi:hypothetical protein
MLEQRLHAHYQFYHATTHTHSPNKPPTNLPFP